MALKNVIGIDHAVVMVKELDKAAENWKRLGFTVSPRGTHSAKMGSGNYTIMLDPDYIDLLGVLRRPNTTRRRAPSSPSAAKASSASPSLRPIPPPARRKFAHAASANRPDRFRAPGNLAGRQLSAAKFRTFQWPVAEAPGGMRIFACQHKTRETVWIPELMKHANAARRLKQVLTVSPEPAGDAAHISG